MHDFQNAETPMAPPKRKPPQSDISEQSQGSKADDLPVKKAVEGEIIQPTNGRDHAPVLDVQQFMMLALQKAPLEEMEKAGRVMLSLAKTAEEQEIELFGKRAEVHISAKLRDPDYIDRRANSRSRRFVRLALPFITVAVIAAPIILVVLDVKSTLLLSLFAIPLMMCATALAALASGDGQASPKELRTLVELAINKFKAGADADDESDEDLRPKRRKK